MGTQAVEEIETPRIHKLEIIEVKPIPLPRERQSSLPPPIVPNKFVASTFTDSEYESDRETVDSGRRFTTRKVIFNPTSHRSASQDREIKKKEAPPSWLNETPPTFDRGTRPEAIQKEEEKPIIEPKKTFAPKKNP